MKRLSESGKRHMLRLDRARPSTGSGNIDEALQLGRPGAKPTHAIIRSYNAIADQLYLTGVPHRAVEEEPVPRIGEPLPEPELKLRFRQVSDARLEYLTDHRLPSRTARRLLLPRTRRPLRRHSDHRHPPQGSRRRVACSPAPSTSWGEA